MGHHTTASIGTFVLAPPPPPPMDLVDDKGLGPEQLAKQYPKFKTSMCFFFKKGRCQNGAECRFAHGLSELKKHQAHFMENMAVSARPPPPPEVPPPPPSTPSAKSTLRPLLPLPSTRSSSWESGKKMEGSGSRAVSDGSIHHDDAAAAARSPFIPEEGYGMCGTTTRTVLVSPLEGSVVGLQPMCSLPTPSLLCLMEEEEEQESCCAAPCWVVGSTPDNGSCGTAISDWYEASRWRNGEMEEVLTSAGGKTAVMAATSPAMPPTSCSAFEAGVEAIRLHLAAGLELSYLTAIVWLNGMGPSMSMMAQNVCPWNETFV